MKSLAVGGTAGVSGRHTCDTLLSVAARRRIGRYFETHDIWLTPTRAQVAQPNGVYGMNVNVPHLGFLQREQRPCQFMVWANVTGQPAISLPLGLHANGLPIGVQLAARPGHEELLIGLGGQLEEAMPWRGIRSGPRRQ